MIINREGNSFKLQSCRPNSQLKVGVLMPVMGEEHSDSIAGSTAWFETVSQQQPHVAEFSPGIYCMQ